MAIYAVTYDLIKQKDYPEIWEAVDELDSHKVTESFYLLSSDYNTKELFTHLKQFVDDDDRLVVAKVNPNLVYTKKAKSGTTKWLNRFKS